MTVVHPVAESSSTPQGEPRSDSAIREDIWSRLWQEDSFRSLDFNSVLVEVENGRVRVWGHVGKDLHRRRIGEIAASIPGVTAVDNDVVTDPELAVRIAQSLSKDERTRQFHLNVSCMHGWVTLIGEVPGKEALEMVEDVVSKVPEVRGILNPPSVTGQSTVSDRPVVQPDLGARVYNWEGLVGTVTRVVIAPQNRLVTHFVARAGREAEGRRITSEYVLPVVLIDVINDGNVILKDGVQSIHPYPEFDPQQFPLAPQDWRPPFPYKPGEVHWQA